LPVVRERPRIPDPDRIPETQSQEKKEGHVRLCGAKLVEGCRRRPIPIEPLPSTWQKARRQLRKERAERCVFADQGNNWICESALRVDRPDGNLANRPAARSRLLFARVGPAAPLRRQLRPEGKRAKGIITRCADPRGCRDVRTVQTWRSQIDAGEGSITEERDRPAWDVGDQASPPKGTTPI